MDNPFGKPAPTDNPFGKDEPEYGALDYAQGGAGGVNVGLANIVGLPVDAINGVMNFFGLGSEQPFGGSKSIKAAADATLGRATSSGTMFSKGPDDTFGRIINRIGEEVGAAGLPAGGILAKAGQYAPSAFNTVKSSAPTLGQAFFGPIARTPGRAAIGEAVAAVGAGAGAGLMQEEFPGNKTAELYGQIFGGIVPSILANSGVGLGVRGINYVRSKMSPEALREQAQETAKGFLQRELSTEARERLTRSNEIADAIPEFSPSLAERTGSPALVRQQEQLEGRMFGPELEDAVGRRVGNEAVVKRFADEVAPGQPGDVGAVVDIAKGRVLDLSGRVDRAAQSATDARRSLAESLPQADLAQEGRILRERLRMTKTEEQAGFERLAREMGLTDPSFVVPFGSFRKSLTDAYDSASKFQTNSGNIGQRPLVVRKIAEGKDGQSFEALMELRSDIGETIRNASRMPSVDDTQIRGLMAMQKTFDNALGDAVAQTNLPEATQMYADFRKRYLLDVVEPLKQRASYDVLHKDPQGAYLIPDENVFKAYFAPGKVTAARQFNQVFGSDQTSRMALEGVALDRFRNQAVRDGVIDPRAAEKFMRDYGAVLDEFPEIKQTISGLVTDNSKLLARQQQLADRAKAVGKSILGREIASLERGRSPEEFIQSALTNPRKMAALTARLRGDETAMSTLQRSVWDSVAGMERPGSISTFIGEHGQALKAAGFSDAHLRSLKLIDGAREMMERTRAPTGSGAIPNFPEDFAQRFGIRPDVLSNRLHAWHTGRTEKTYLGMNIASLIMARKQGHHADQVWKTLLYDPTAAQDVANSLLRGRVSEPTAKRLQARFFALGVTPFSEDEK